ncbi:hypothetical protein [Caminibacter mediatlanticus]|uniref:Uncharacterized protein n=1 Tax=Caminibacter mediatlanticus TB-2 TaxID=391592 RepID=A0AAI9F2Z4_9BACT|nr:hypothetical protein [Caminibacter mediatlanticus]EDM24318.1 hypothetical protein CMTB2_02343 [Caminibacter mediatlanticus TB-2]
MSDNKWFELTFKQIEPINIGQGGWGVVNETRIFIPGITMWGALTNEYFKITGKHSEHIFEEISCFYPKIDGKVLYPSYKNGEFYLGDISESEFRQKYVKSFTSTAINPITRNAKDESLHEIDLIYPNNIEWVGYINCKKEYLDEIKKIYIGGDVRYGFGLMKLESIKEKNYNCNLIKGIYQTNNYKNPLKNYLKFNNQKFEGELEILPEFDFTQGQKIIKNAEYYITPGSKLLE